MLQFIRAHGFDPGDAQRPLLAGALSGAAAAVPAMLVLLAFGAFHAMAEQILRLSEPWTAALLLAAFVAAGTIYGALLRRAGNDRRGGWLFGTVYGLLLWIAAPVCVLPLIGRAALLAGTAGKGLLVAFLLWGLVLGFIFRFVHRPLEAGLHSAHGGAAGSFGPESAVRDLLSQWRSRR